MILALNSTSQIMRQVIYALVPGVGVAYYFFGWGVILQIILAVASAIMVEAIFLKIRNQPIKPAIGDGSAALSGILLAIAIPNIAPWWVIVMGVAFAIIFGKQLYGGLGNNPFNPAMLGYGFLLISYPLQMTQWQVVFLDFGSAVNVIFNQSAIDGLTGATLLEDRTLNTVSSLWINLSFLLGGLYLLLRRVIFWHIPLSFLLGILLSAVVFSENTLLHLTTGATMLGAFFIATDPISASTTPKGRLIYGFLIGVLVVIIRTFGGYPDGVAFAVLLLNICVPLIDYYTQPKVFGQ